MKKILIPTDFSDNSWNAIKYVLQLFKDDICTFYLLNTYTPIIYHYEYAAINQAEFGLVDAIRNTSIKSLEEIEEKIQKEFSNSNHSFERISKFNSLIPEINEQVQNKAIDYIVMGTKGATGAKEVLFGSNTVHVLKQVKCPVMAIPNDFDYEKPHELLFPTDFEIEYEDKHLKSIIDIAEKHISRVNILHASYGYDLSEQQESNKRTLEGSFKNLAHLFHDVSNQNVEEAIANFQIKNKVNMLIMINNKHSFFENLFFKKLINHIGFHLNIPFLVIPSKIS
jgi:nucleotide-binding universal stress UspA family protein